MNFPLAKLHEHYENIFWHDISVCLLLLSFLAINGPVNLNPSADCDSCLTIQEPSFILACLHNDNAHCAQNTVNYLLDEIKYSLQTLMQKQPSADK